MEGVGDTDNNSETRPDPTRTHLRLAEAMDFIASPNGGGKGTR